MNLSCFKGDTAVLHPARRALCSDWSVNSFIVDVHEKKMSCSKQKILTELENYFLIDNHHKAVYGQVETEYSTYMHI